jgi:electron transport complex protein RnfG
LAIFSRILRVVGAGAVLVSAAPLLAKVFLTQEEALKLAFPAPARVVRRTAFLTAQQQSDVAKKSGSRPPNPLATYYTGEQDGREIGTVYFDTHVVRTETETALIEVTPEGKVVRIEILSFSEPEEYLPRPRWYAQFQGRELNDDLSLKRGIHPVSGATLTARATTDAVRRVLALDAVIHQIRAAGPAAGRP